MKSEIMIDDSSSEIAHVFGKPGGDLNTTMSVSSDDEELDNFAAALEEGMNGTGGGTMAIANTRSFQAALEGGIVGAGDDTVAISNRSFEAGLEEGITGAEDETVAISNRSFEAVVKMYSDSLHAFRDIGDTDFHSRNICREGEDKNDESSDITIVFTEDKPDTENDGGDDAEDNVLSRKFGAAERWIKDKRTRKRKLTACLVALGVLVVLLLVIAIVILAVSLGKETNRSSNSLLGPGNGLLEAGSGGYQGSTDAFDIQTDAPTIRSEPSMETPVPSFPTDESTITSESSMETSVPTSPLTGCIPFVEAVEDCFGDRIVMSFIRCGAGQDSFIGIWNVDDAKDPQRLPNPKAWSWTCTGENCDDREASSFSGALAFEIELPKGTYIAHMVRTQDQHRESASSIASSQTFDVDRKCG